MTIQEAWRIIEELRGWNTSQTSISFAMYRIEVKEDEIYHARREALRKA